MEIVNKTFFKYAINKPEQELIELEKQEYKLLGTYLRRKGLKLFAYNPITKQLYEVETNSKEAVNIIKDKDGHLTTIDTGQEEANVDGMAIHFEALNLRCAFNRLQKYKLGKIKELCNLREPGEGISLL